MGRQLPSLLSASSKGYLAKCKATSDLVPGSSDQLILTQWGPLNSDNYSDIRESLGTTSALTFQRFCLLEDPPCILPSGSELSLQAASRHRNRNP